ncbi:MAG: tRNA lysidine(34) synthetase TilS [Gammaproteobacteria bacterium]
MVVNESLKQALLQLPTTINQLVVAYSGGLDSTVLLHALHTLYPSHTDISPLPLATINKEDGTVDDITFAPMAGKDVNSSLDITPAPSLRYWVGFKLSVLHVHHGLSPNADAWAQHCQAFAQTLSLPIDITYVDAKPKPGESPEAAARRARYGAFASMMSAEKALLLAHHANDQAETVLLQLLRGAGLRGIAAMPALTSFETGSLLRPFLAVTRAELETYAKTHHLTWIDDESNNNLDYKRNYLRHTIMPLLEKKWPATASCLSRSAHHCAEAEELLQELAIADIVKAMDEDAEALKILPLRTLTLPRLHNALRHWFTVCKLPLPSTVKLTEIVQTIIYGRHDAMPCVDWPGVEVRRFQHGLYAFPPLPVHDPAWRCEWDLKQDLVLPAKIGTLHAIDYQALADGQPLVVAFRVGGEKLRLQGRQGHHSLKNMMQEWHIPPWLRCRIPLIFRQNELIAVVGYWIG